MKRKSFIYFFLSLLLLIGVTIPPFGSIGDVRAASKDPNDNYAGPYYIYDSSIFPDPIFQGVLASRTYDRNGDKYLDESEILYLEDLHCEGTGVESIKGVEKFWNLKGLYCEENYLTDLPIWNNKNLVGIWCSDNPLKIKNMDLSCFPNLVWIYCYNNNLESLNVRNNPHLAFLETNSNPLYKGGGLDVTQNSELEHLICGDCGLTSINLRNNKKLQHLDIQNNKLKSLDLSQNTLMKRLDIWGNQLGNYDVSHLKGLQSYNCADTGATIVDVSQNKELTKLSVAWNEQLKTLNVSTNTKLVYLDCCDCRLTSLDISNCPQLHFLQAFINPNLNEINIANNPNLIKTYNEGVKKSEPNACYSYSYTIKFGGDDSTSGDSLYFLCWDNEGNDNNVISSYRHKAKLITTGGNPNVLPDKSKYDNVADGSNLITRGMAVEILYEIAGSPSVAGLSTRFTDVKPGCWYENAVKWGEQFALCMGYPYFADSKFCASKYLSREDLAYILMRYAENTDGFKRSIDFGRSDDYLDYYEVDYEHWEAVCWAATWHIIEGKGGATKSEQYFDPHGKVTREEFKATVRNFLKENYTDPAPYESIISKADTTPVYEAEASGSSGSGSGASAGAGAGGNWVKEGNDYYYYTPEGKKETNCYRDGYWLDANGKYDPAYSGGKWKCDSSGWWYEDNGWYPVSQWLKIDGYWYYFTESGYMDYSEYRDGCWLGSDGAWVEEYYGGHWCSDSYGWWYEDAAGWYPYNQYLWVDGTEYWFDASGYWA